MTDEAPGLRSAVLADPGDGSLGPLLRVADDRLAPGAGYGRHHHRGVDVVAVLLEGRLRHDWAAGAVLAAGDVAVLRSGCGLVHDEVAGDGGARVLQCHLRADGPGAAPGHRVHRRAAGWVDLGRDDARLWVAAAGAHDAPPGLLLLPGPGGVDVRLQDGGPVRGPALVWQLDRGRPAWATGG